MTNAGDTTGVRLRWAGATDVGQVRQVNQDSMSLGPAVFVVADGMGGHAGGEVASRIAVDTIDAELDSSGGAAGPHRVLDLVTAVQAANERVWEHSAEDPSLAGMGTTVVAIGLVEEGGETRLAIVNVGDSRAYRLSEGHLDQVSDDHSLVGELFREGRISAEEARHHPQKNIVTRAVGIERHVEVDEFQILPRSGDRYLLCSDGLTDEVDEGEIAEVLRTVADPDEAAQLLVRRANANGGRDNITVVIVDVEADGLDPTALGAAGAGGAVPDDPDFSAHADQDTEALRAVPAGGARAGTDAPAAAPVADDDPEAPSGRTPRALTARSAAFVLAVVVLLGAGSYLAYRYAQDTYHVTVVGDDVAIYQGRPGGVLWLDPELVERTGIDVDDVPASVLDDLEEGVSQPTLDRARRYVANLEERIEDARPPVTTTTTTSTTSPTTTAPAPASPTTAAAPG